MAIWEKVRKGQVYELVRVCPWTIQTNIRHLAFLQKNLVLMSKNGRGDIGLMIRVIHRKILQRNTKGSRVVLKWLSQV